MGVFHKIILNVAFGAAHPLFRSAKLPKKVIDPIARKLWIVSPGGRRARTPLGHSRENFWSYCLHVGFVAVSLAERLVCGQSLPSTTEKPVYPK